MKLCLCQRSERLSRVFWNETAASLSYHRRKPRSLEEGSSELQHHVHRCIRASLQTTSTERQTELNVAVQAAIFTANAYSTTPDGNPVIDNEASVVAIVTVTHYRLQRQANSACVWLGYSVASTTTPVALWKHSLYARRLALLTWLAAVTLSLIDALPCCCSQYTVQLNVEALWMILKFMLDWIGLDWIGLSEV